MAIFFRRFFEAEVRGPATVGGGNLPVKELGRGDRARVLKVQSRPIEPIDADGQNLTYSVDRVTVRGCLFRIGPIKVGEYTKSDSVSVRCR